MITKEQKRAWDEFSGKLFHTLTASGTLPLMTLKADKLSNYGYIDFPECFTEEEVLYLTRDDKRFILKEQKAAQRRGEACTEILYTVQVDRKLLPVVRGNKRLRVEGRTYAE